MTGHIPESFIEELLSRIDIVEVISSRIPLKRQGANYSAKCPFHTEKSPSFTVSPTKQFYHCFGCGAHGSVIRFLMEYDSIHFVEACESLAESAGLTLPVEIEKGSKASLHKQIYQTLKKANQFFQNVLRTPQGKKAIEYLKSRGLTGHTAKFFEIGFAPPGWDNLINEFQKEKEPLRDLLEAGLVIEKVIERKDRDTEKNNHNNNHSQNQNQNQNQSQSHSHNPHQSQYYDRFRDRITFPIRDSRGRILGFGGRILGNEQPKYLNSPESPVFSKGHEVYGLYEARQKNSKLTHLIVVEGYIDVLCLSQFGIDNVVATLGTALTEHHLKLLFRQVSELYFCFDGDTAGKAAAHKAMKNCLPHMKEGRRVKFIFLPNGEDPDSFVRRQGKAAFLNLIQKATSLSDYLFDSLSITLDLKHIDGRAELVRRAKPLIAELPKGVLQQMMYERLSELSGVPQNTQGYLSKRKGDFKKKFGHQHIASSAEPPPSPALRAVAMLLNDRNLLCLISEPIRFMEVDIPGTTLLCVLIDILRKEPEISLENLEDKLPEECANYFKSIDLKNILRFVPKDGQEAELTGALGRLKERAAEQALEKLLLKAKENALSSEEKLELRYLIDQKEKNWVD